MCSGPPDFTCVCDLGWTSDLPPPTPAPGPPAPRCSRDCGCNFHSHCRKRGPGFCDECQGERPSSQMPLDWPRGSFLGVPISCSLPALQCPLTQLCVPLPHCLLLAPGRLQWHPPLWRGLSPPSWALLVSQVGPGYPPLKQPGEGRDQLSQLGRPLPALAPDSASCLLGLPQTGPGGSTVNGAGPAALAMPRARAAADPASAMSTGTHAAATVTTSAGSASARTTPRVPTASSALLATMGDPR